MAQRNSFTKKPHDKKTSTNPEIINTAYLNDLERKFQIVGSDTQALFNTKDKAIEIDLRNAKLPESEIAKEHLNRLFAILKKNAAKIKTLHCGTVFNQAEAAVEKLADVISAARHLEKFSIKGLELNAQNIGVLIAALNPDHLKPSISDLELDELRIINAVARNEFGERKTSLDLKKTAEADAKTITELGEALTDLPLTRLALTANNLAFVNSLAAILKRNSQLTSLEVTGNAFEIADDEALKNFKYALLKHNLANLKMESAQSWWDAKAEIILQGWNHAYQRHKAQMLEVKVELPEKIKPSQGVKLLNVIYQSPMKMRSF